MLILIVDDSEEDRFAARLYLSDAARTEGLSFRFVEAENGEDGLAAWRSETPDCILLDHYLPDMDSLEFLEHLKGSGEVPVPVVILTVSSDKSLAAAALRAGAQEYLPKRFLGPEMLLRAVQSAQDRFMLLADRQRAESALARMNDELERRVRERTADLVAENRRRLEAEALLHQAQKMEAIGQLTGGIAHDFNNILQAIVGNLDLMMRRSEPGASPEAGLSAEATGALRHSIDNALKAANSGAKLTHRLLAFGRRQALEPTKLDVNGLVAGMSELIRRTLGETITVETALADGLWPTFADANQLEAAFLNLIVNARDAMPSGGRLTIETANVHLDEAYTAHLNDVTPGHYVMLSVTDSGGGIPKSVMERVFEPFVTTKEVGHGTGLGLAIVYGFVKQSEGHVRIYSEVGEGTTAKIYLPRMLAVGQGAAPLSPQSRQATERGMLPRARNGESVLVVEDDVAVNQSAREALEDLGYHVLTAADAPAAKALLEASQDGIDLLFTDLVLPGGTNGRALAERWPTLPVLFTTGYSGYANISHGLVAPYGRLLGKPYSLEDLAQRIREAIDGTPESRSKLN